MEKMYRGKGKRIEGMTEIMKGGLGKRRIVWKVRLKQNLEQNQKEGKQKEEKEVKEINGAREVLLQSRTVGKIRISKELRMSLRKEIHENEQELQKKEVMQKKEGVRKSCEQKKREKEEKVGGKEIRIGWIEDMQQGQDK
eukprot:TRINITY_DN19843_c0_g1_i1.p4 TRINITY_DN19843_c0_g1~~TRINITY_DN19843_c0_g1_i1.p4  ORF type:complete len:140 (-),score=23.10 TRINITY_DN19843_c0_g1_i1:26-445(-)